MNIALRTNVASVEDVRRTLERLVVVLNQLDRNARITADTLAIVAASVESHTRREDGTYLLREDDWRIVREQPSAVSDAAKTVFGSHVEREDGGLVLREDDTMLRREFSSRFAGLSLGEIMAEQFAEFMAPPFGS